MEDPGFELLPDEVDARNYAPQARAPLRSPRQPEPKAAKAKPTRQVTKAAKKEDDLDERIARAVARAMRGESAPAPAAPAPAEPQWASVQEAPVRGPGWEDTGTLVPSGLDAEEEKALAEFRKKRRNEEMAREREETERAERPRPKGKWAVGLAADVLFLSAGGFAGIASTVAKPIAAGDVLTYGGIGALMLVLGFGLKMMEDRM